MNRATTILAINVVILAVVVLMLSHRITVLGRRAMDYDAHFGYKSRFPYVGQFGIHEEGGDAK